MNNKIFYTLVVILSFLIVCATFWLIMNVMEYNNVTNQNDTVYREENKDKTTVIENKEVNNGENNKISNYILPSDTREITYGEIINYDLDTLNKAYNEIFARHGHDFKSSELKEYFSAQSWYKAIPGKTVAVSELSSLESKNIELIKNRIDEIKGER